MIRTGEREGKRERGTRKREVAEKERRRKRESKKSFICLLLFFCIFLFFHLKSVIGNEIGETRGDATAADS